MPKNYKKHKLIMLPTDGESNIIKILKDTIHYTTTKNIVGGVYQHFYLLSDEEIKEGDWIYDTKNNLICIFKGLSKYNIINSAIKTFNEPKKIIATTNTSLETHKLHKYLHKPSGKYHDDESVIMESTGLISLPQIPESFISLFIEEYNKGNVIEEVEVEYYNLGFDISAEFPYHSSKLKLNPDNTINIRMVNKKIIYTDREVRSMCKTSFEMYMSDDSLGDDELRLKWEKWFEQNKKK